MRYHVIVRDWNNNDGLIVFFFQFLNDFSYMVLKNVFFYFSLSFFFTFLYFFALAFSRSSYTRVL